MRSIVLCALVLVSCESTKLTEADNPLCNTSCYTGTAETRSVGECKDGIWLCENNQVVSCFGEQLPREEYCSSKLDLNCDGLQWINVVDREIGTPCGAGIGACTKGSINCLEGNLVCLGEGQPRQGDCSGRDLDCDGIPNNIDRSLCYSGNLDDLVPLSSECRAGVTSCVGGAESCVGEVLPADETCGAKRDANCNGILDDVVGLEEHATDIVIMLDRSGSMDPYYPSIRYALERFALTHSSKLYRYALIAVPGSFEQPTLMFVDSESTTLVNYVRNLNGWTGGFEPSYTVFLQVELRLFDLLLRPEAKTLLIWFGDEERQGGTVSASASPTELDRLRDEILEQLGYTGDRFIGFSTAQNLDDYSIFGDASGGASFLLTLSGDEMLFALNSALVVCD